MKVNETTFPSGSSQNSIQERGPLVEAIIQAFVELVLTQKYADMPGWIDSDLTVSQVRAIYFLVSRGQLTVSELAVMLDMGRPAASVLVQQLVIQGLAERAEDSADRRRVWVRLTDLGNEFVNGRREQRESKFRVLLQQMDEGDLACLHAGLTALLEVFPRSP